MKFRAQGWPRATRGQGGGWRQLRSLRQGFAEVGAPSWGCAHSRRPGWRDAGLVVPRAQCADCRTGRRQRNQNCCVIARCSCCQGDRVSFPRLPWRLEGGAEGCAEAEMLMLPSAYGCQLTPSWDVARDPRPAVCTGCAWLGRPRLPPPASRWRPQVPASWGVQGTPNQCSVTTGGLVAPFCSGWGLRSPQVCESAAVWGLAGNGALGPGQSPPAWRR